MVGLGDLPGGAFASWALSTSSDGSVVVGTSLSQDTSNGSVPEGWEAFRWTPDGGMVGLGDLPGFIFYSSAHDVSADGSVVAGGAPFSNFDGRLNDVGTVRIYDVAE